MPHKRNPFIPGEVISYSHLSRSTMMDALSSMEGTNERDVRTIGLENEYLSRSCVLADAALDRCILLMRDLESHEIIYEIAQKAISENKNFRQLLLEDSRTASKLTEQELNKIMDPAHYIGLSTYFADVIAGKE